MNTLFRDFRYAARSLMRSPAFSIAAILTLAIGIASNTTLFSLVDAILWKPYPYPAGDRLVVIQGADTTRGLRWGNLSLPDARDFEQQAQLLDSFAIWDWEPYGLSGGDQPVRVGGTRTSARYFEVLGVEPLAGRTFIEGEDQPGAEPVVVLSEGLWRSSFGSRDIVGNTVLINAQPTTVIGIMPAGTEYPDRTRLWVPMRFDEESAPRGANFLGSIGRLAEGAELSALDAEIKIIGKRLVDDYPEENSDRVYRAVPLRDVLTSDIEPLTLSVLGIITFVLLIVCANVANLLLARGATREQEVAIRRALGASSRRLAQLLLCEATLLAFAGGLLGFALGWLGMRHLVDSFPVEIPPWVQTGMDWRVALYTFGVTLLAGLIFSLFPMLQSLRRSLLSPLRESGRRQGTSVRGGRLRSSLVVSEVALSLVLLAGAGLMVKSLLGLSSVDPGFEPSGSLTVGLDLLNQVDAEPEVRAGQFDKFLERFKSLPGVEAVGSTNFFPLKGRSNTVRISFEGQDVEGAKQNPTPQIGLITPGYFQAMRIPLLQGRDFDPHPPADAPRDVIISQALARSLWPDGQRPQEEFLGRRLRLGLGADDEEPAWLTVRGVVGDITHRDLGRQRATHLYLPYANYAPPRMTVIVRYSGDPSAMTAAIRTATAEIDPHQPLHEIMATDEVLATSIWQWRFFTTIAWLFGAVALILAMIGVYGTMTYSVSQRTSEVGIRMALGAGSGEVIRLILRQGGRLILLGLVIGLPLTLGLSKLLSGILYSVGTFEPTALGASMLLLLLVALPALLIPARRAARVDPASSLRAD